MKMISQGTTVRIARGSTFGMLRDTLNLGRDKVLAEYNGELFGMGREIPDAGAHARRLCMDKMVLKDGRIFPVTMTRGGF